MTSKFERFFFKVLFIKFKLTFKNSKTPEDILIEGNIDQVIIF